MAEHEEEEKEPEGFTIALNQENFRVSCYGAILGMLLGLLRAGEAMLAEFHPADPRKATLEQHLEELKQLHAQLLDRVPPGTMEAFAPRSLSNLPKEQRERAKAMGHDLIGDDDEDEEKEGEGEPKPWDIPPTKH